MIERKSEVFLIAFVSILLQISVILAVASHSNWTALARFGCLTEQICYAKSNARLLPQSSSVFKSGGYDGQFYYYIARTLYTSDKPLLDSVQFRMSRIAYPALTGWATFFGSATLLFAMIALPLIVCICSAIFLAMVSTERGSMAAWCFALNPFSVLCASLLLADGLALSLTLSGICLLKAKLNFASKGAVQILGFFLLALSCLCKETLAIVPLSVGFVGAINFLFKKEGSDRTWIFYFVTILPLLVWYWIIGFSPMHASERGVTLFSGLISYISRPDAMFSGRGLICIWMVLALVYITVRRHSSDSYRSGALIIIGSVAFTLIASSEYWDNFANVARLLVPTIAGVWLIESDCVKESKWPARTVAIFYLLFSVILIVREARATSDIFFL